MPSKTEDPKWIIRCGLMFLRRLPPHPGEGDGRPIWGWTIEPETDDRLKLCKDEETAQFLADYLGGSLIVEPWDPEKAKALRANAEAVA